jgi:hypothetical protein
MYETLGFNDDCLFLQTDKPFMPVNADYFLSHASISLYDVGKPVGHDIAGIINSKGEPYIYDSNGRYLKINWMKDFELLKTYAKQNYGFKNPKVHLIVTYIKKAVLTDYLTKFKAEDEKIQKELEEQLVRQESEYSRRQKIIGLLAKNNILYATFGKNLNNTTRNTLFTNKYWKNTNLTNNGKQLVQGIVRKIKGKLESEAMTAYFRRSKNQEAFFSKNIKARPVPTVKPNITSKLILEINRGYRNARLSAMLKNTKSPVLEAVEKRIQKLIRNIKNGTSSLKIENHNAEKIKNAKRKREQELINEIKNSMSNRYITNANTNTDAIRAARANLQKRREQKAKKQANILKLRTMNSIQNIQSMRNGYTNNKEMLAYINKILAPLQRAEREEERARRLDAIRRETNARKKLEENTRRAKNEANRRETNARKKLEENTHRANAQKKRDEEKAELNRQEAENKRKKEAFKARMAALNARRAAIVRNAGKIGIGNLPNTLTVV